MTRKRLTTLGAIGLVAVLVAAGVVAGLRVWGDAERSQLERAVAMAPDAQRYSWTDWAGVRSEVGVELSSASGSEEVLDFLDEGYDADLTSSSALVQSAQILHVQYGFSPASVDWELFSQSEEGAVIMLGLPGSVSYSGIESSLRRLGYAEPDADDGVWKGTADQLATIGSVTPELTFLALDAAKGLILASDTEAGVTTGLEAVDEERGVAAGLGAAVTASGDALSAAVYTSDYACGALAMSQADTTDQDQADELIATAGDLNPYTGYVMAVRADGDVRVAMSFETDDQARTNADTRAALAAGPAPGQGGVFADRFTVDRVAADGTVVTMDLEPAEGSYVFSDLSNGPVLFATC